MNIIHTLRKYGLKVKVKHKRRFTLNIPHVNDLYITKGEMKFNNGDVQSLLDHIKDNISFKINNNGGETEVAIFRPSDKSLNPDDWTLISVGRAECSEKDNFAKKLALSIACGRALLEMKTINKEEYDNYHKFLKVKRYV